MNGKSITVFIGSSYREMPYRRSLGNRVRELSYKWEKLGVRIYLKRWEDFRATYKGKSKQEEYIDELVLSSNICIFFFGERVGCFTERELDACIAAKHPNVHCYRVGFGRKFCKLKAKVKELIEAKGLSIKDSISPQTLADDVAIHIEAYIRRYNLASGKPINNMKEKWLYTTMPDDMANKREEFGTTIRDLDDISEKFLNVRCKLHPLQHKELLTQTDHYVPYCANQTSKYDIAEMKKALELLDAKQRLKEITFFVTPFSDIHKSNENVKNLIEGRELFTCKVNGPETIKWELFSWLMRENNIVMGQPLPGLSMKNGELLIDGRSVVTMKTLDPSGKALKLLKSRDKIDSHIKKETDNQALSVLLQKKADIEIKLWFAVSTCINNWIFKKYREHAQEKLTHGDMSVVKLTAQLGKDRLEALELERINVINELQSLVNSIDYQIANKQTSLGEPGVAEELKILLENKEELQRTLVEKGVDSQHELLETQLYLVGLFDSYIHPYQVSQEEDDVYRRIITDADKYGLLNPQTEVIRMNYGNSFIRREEYREALNHYHVAIGNLEQMDDNNWLTLRIKTTIYTRIYHTYREMGDEEHMGIMLYKLKQHVDYCANLGDGYLTDKAMYIAAILAARGTKLDGGPADVKAAIEVYANVRQMQYVPTTDQWYGDIFCFLPCQIAGYLIDHLGYYKAEERQWVSKIAEKHLLDAEKNAIALKKVNLRDGLYYLSEINHQLGFLYYNIGISFWGKASECYKQSLNHKQKLMDIDGRFEHEMNYAQTLVNLGAVMVGKLQIMAARGDKSVSSEATIAIASEAVGVYNRHRNDDSILSEQHYYEALQLLGTAYYYSGIIEKKDSLIDKSLSLLQECWDWNLAHPDNTYSGSFANNAGEILAENGRI